jgi:hypothetical protein
VVDPDLDGERRPGADLLAHERLSVAADGEEGRACPPALQDLRANGLVAPDDSEAGSFEQLDLPVALGGPAGDERMERRAESEALDARRDIVHHAVGDHDDAREPVGRHVRKAVGEGGEQPRPVIAFAVLRLDEAWFHVGQVAEAALQFRAHLVGHRLPIAEGLRGRAIDHHCDDVFHLVALFLDESRVRERQENEAECKCAHERDRAARDDGEDGEQGDDGREAVEHEGGDER